MPALRPRSVTDVLVGILGELTSPQSDTPGQLLSVVVAAVGGLTSAGLVLGPVAAPVNATFVAAGTSNHVMTINDRTLYAEIARSPVTGRSALNGTPLIQGLLSALQGNGWIWEIGIFGAGATAAADSGTLYARVVLDLPLLKYGGKLVLVQWSPN